MMRALTVIAILIPASAHSQTPPPLDQHAVARGAELYAEACASCHGADLEGQPNWETPGENGVYPAPPHDASGHTWHHPDGMLFAYTKLGGAETLRRMGLKDAKSGMPGFADTLSDADMADILDFIKSKWPERERSYQFERTQADKRSSK